MRLLRAFTVLLTILSFQQLKAQDGGKAIGLRLGGGNVSGAEISYQHGLSEANRLEANLGWNNNSAVDAFKLTGLYEWTKDLSDLGPGFSWYYGVGAGLGYIDWGGINGEGSDALIISAEGIVGLEYRFEVPLQLTLDINPGFNLVGGFDDLDLDLALGVRYLF